MLASTLELALIPVLAVGAAVVLVGYEIAQAWTADSRAAKEFADSVKALNKDLEEHLRWSVLAVEVAGNLGDKELAVAESLRQVADARRELDLHSGGMAESVAVHGGIGSRDGDAWLVK